MWLFAAVAVAQRTATKRWGFLNKSKGIRTFDGHIGILNIITTSSSDLNWPTVSHYPGQSQTQIAQKNSKFTLYKVYSCHIVNRESSFRSQWDKGLFFKPFTKSWIWWKQDFTSQRDHKTKRSFLMRLKSSILEVIKWMYKLYDRNVLINIWYVEIACGVYGMCAFWVWTPLLYQVDRIAFFHMTSTSCGLSCTDALPMSCCSPCGDVFSIACDVGVGRSTFVGRCAQGGPAIGCWSYKGFGYFCRLTTLKP